jgi:hypothetical protein
MNNLYSKENYYRLYLLCVECIYNAQQKLTDQYTIKVC